MRKVFLISCFIFLRILASGQTIGLTDSTPKSFIAEYKRSYYSQGLGFQIPDTYNSLLYDTVITWLGTPYKFAGNGEKGIDCSGFMNILYDRVMGIRLGARNSGEIYNLVEKIDPTDIKEGDLVFFSIRKRRISHIGMYLGNNKFVHSSTSKGVTISDLDEPYYKKHFAGAGRHHNDSIRITLQPQE